MQNIHPCVSIVPPYLNKWGLVLLQNVIVDLLKICRSGRMSAAGETEERNYLQVGSGGSGIQG